MATIFNEERAVKRLTRFTHVPIAVRSRSRIPGRNLNEEAQMRSAKLFVLCALAIVGCSASDARAQVAQAALRGTVVDESGGALPGAAVTATETETGAVRTTVSRRARHVCHAGAAGWHAIR